MTIALIFGSLFLLMLTGLPIFLSMGTLAAGTLLLSGQSLGSMATTFYGALDSFVLLSIPLFMLMSLIMAKGGVGDDLFDVVHVWLRHWPAGLAFTTIITCAIFAAICGSSAATAATIGMAAIPPMLKYKYDKRFVLGLVAAGGTLGILIPPSGPMIIYGAITDVSVGQLFTAGVVPGIVLSVIFLAYGWLACRNNPDLVREDSSTWGERWKAFRRAAPSLIMPPVIIGGIFSGIVTPTEAAGIGAVLAFIIVYFIYRRITLKDMLPILSETVKTSGMILMIIAAAHYFSQVLTINQVPQQVVQFILDQHLGKWGFLIIFNFLLMFLGCFLEVIGCLLITMPIVFPILAALDIDPVWFCIIFIVNMEMALITPPVGMNLFVLMGITDTSMKEIVKGVWPFILLMVLGLVIIMVFPQLSLWLVEFSR